jgi:gamma-glutamylcyclotransferase
MEDHVNVFCYGSNLSSRCLHVRTPGAKFLTIAYLKDHKLLFNKPSKHGAGKANLKASADANDLVWGAVYSIPAAEMRAFAYSEGKGYDEGNFTVLSKRNVEIPVTIYFAAGDDCNDTLMPYDWYKAHILNGAEEHGLPDEYIEMLRGINSFPDPDEDKTKSELSIYL